MYNTANLKNVPRRKKRMKKLLALLTASIMAVSMAACSAPAEETTTETGDSPAFKIGVLQLVQHDALDQSNAGFFAALDDAGIKYTADQQNASGDQVACQTIAEKLVNDGSDLILAIATPAAQAVAGVTSPQLSFRTPIGRIFSCRYILKQTINRYTKAFCQ